MIKKYTKMAQLNLQIHGIDEIVQTFINHGADLGLAQDLAELYKPMKWALKTGRFKQRIPAAYAGLDFQYLGFANLLMGKTHKANEFFQTALESGNYASSGHILHTLEEVQQIVSLSLPYLPHMASDDTLF